MVHKRNVQQIALRLSITLYSNSLLLSIGSAPMHRFAEQFHKPADPPKPVVKLDLAAGVPVLNPLIPLVNQSGMPYLIVKVQEL